MTKANLKLVETRDPAREALAQAIANREAAQAALNASHAAEESARDRRWAAQSALDAIKQRHAEQPVDGAEAFMTQFAAGHNIDLDELERPAAVRHAELVRAQRAIDTLAQVRESIESGMETKRRALEWAEIHVADAVREAIAASIDVESLIETALAAEAAAVAARAALAAVGRLLPNGASQKSIAEHLGRAWLAHEMNFSSSPLPAGQRFHQFAAALEHDADAVLAI